MLYNASKVVVVHFPPQKNIASEHTTMCKMPLNGLGVTDISQLLISANGVDEWRVGHEMGPLQMRLS